MRRLSFYALLLALTAASAGADWPQFRGPFFNGSSDEKNLPSDFSTTENVKWAIDLPGCSAATPVVVGDHVFISCVDEATDELLAMCFDRQTGKLNWRQAIAKGTQQDTRSNYAAPTPAAGDNRVFFFYGNGDLVAFDYAGQRLWSMNLQQEYGPFAFQWTFSTSPLLFDGKLYMQVLQRDVPARGRGSRDKVNESYLLALDPATGKQLWRHVRPSQARAESREAFTTPVPTTVNGVKQLLVVGGDDLSGHDPETGKEIWRWGTWNPRRTGDWRLVPSAVAGGDVVLACAPKGDPIYAVTVGGEGQLSDDALAWVSDEQRELSSDVPTPAFYDGDFFILGDVRRTLARVDPRTGEIKWKQTTPGRAKYEASPTVADGKVYVVNFDGDVTIFDAADGRIINTISMDNPRRDAVRATIVAAHGNLFIRTTNKLYCIGQ